MGFNSWNFYHCNIDESLVKSIADAMATNGMKEAGYEYINIDDCWQVERFPNGTIPRPRAVPERHARLVRLRPLQGPQIRRLYVCIVEVPPLAFPLLCAVIPDTTTLPPPSPPPCRHRPRQPDLPGPARRVQA